LVELSTFKHVSLGAKRASRQNNKTDAEQCKRDAKKKLQMSRDATDIAVLKKNVVTECGPQNTRYAEWVFESRRGVRGGMNSWDREAAERYKLGKLALESNGVAS
jgi:hypothetical protein